MKHRQERLALTLSIILSLATIAEPFALVFPPATSSRLLWLKATQSEHVPEPAPSRIDPPLRITPAQLQDKTATILPISPEPPSSPHDRVDQERRRERRWPWVQWFRRVRSVFANLRPSDKFRVQLALVLLTAISASYFVFPTLGFMISTKKWVSEQGFSGISALGRTFVMVWGLFVTYPQMLDQNKQESEQAVQRNRAEDKRQRLNQLADQMANLRREITAIDAEIRSFRREVIAMQVYSQSGGEGRKLNTETQAAIGAEMAHLVQLRSELQASLDETRASWVESGGGSLPVTGAVVNM